MANFLHGSWSMEPCIRSLLMFPEYFYLNTKASVSEGFPGRVVNKILPHGHRCCNLIEVIYETKVGRDFNTILQIGCVCKVDKSAKKRNTKEGLDLRELHMKTATECSYLEPSTSFFYLYHRRSGYLSSVFSFLVNRPCRSGHSLQKQRIVATWFKKQFREACQALSIETPMSTDASGTKKFLPNGEKILRNQLDQVYFGKTKEMVCTLRPPSELLSMTLPGSKNP
ncbi:DNA polymerase epsilon catalytic subunit A [Tanacetum coccineum]